MFCRKIRGECLRYFPWGNQGYSLGGRFGVNLGGNLGCKLWSNIGGNTIRRLPYKVQKPISSVYISVLDGKPELDAKDTTFYKNDRDVQVGK